MFCANKKKRVCQFTPTHAFINMKRLVFTKAATVLILLTFSQTTTATCPFNCTCYSDSLLRCHASNLSTFNFEKVSNFKTLDLTDNQLGKFDALDSSFLSASRDLFLSKNKISNLGVETINIFSSLKKLHLDNNFLTNVDNLFPDWSTYSTNIDELRLQKNLIEKIDFIKSSRISNVRFLDLSENSILSLDGDELGAFSDLPKLERLDLASNMISVVSTESLLNQMPNLQFLDLKNNPLKNFNKVSFPKLLGLILSKTDINNINLDAPTLEMLDVSETKISSINLDNQIEASNARFSLIAGGENFKELLQGMSHVDELTVSSMVKNAVIDLGEFRNIKTMKISDVDRITASSAFHEIQTLQLTNVLYLDIFDVSRVDLWPTGLKHLEIINFQTPASFFNKIFFEKWTSLEVLVIKRSEFEFIPALKLPALRTLILDKNSKLKQIETWNDPGNNLETLSAVDCKISKIPNFNTNQFNRISILDVRNNLIETIEPDFSKNVKLFYAEGNPFDCSCEALNYQNWLKSQTEADYSVQVYQQLNYKCYQKSSKILFEDLTFCEETTNKCDLQPDGSCKCDENHFDSHVPYIKLNRILETTSIKNQIPFVEDVLHSFKNLPEGVIANFTIDFKNQNNLRQNVSGFGGTLTDSSANLIENSFHKNDILNAYYSDSGSRYTYLKLPIGSSEFSQTSYTYLDKTDDFKLDSFELADVDKNVRRQLVEKITFINNNLLSESSSFAQKLNIVAAPYTAPPWMKTNQDYFGNGKLVQTPEYLQTYAEYFIKYVESYADLNITISEISIQSSPTKSTSTGEQTVWSSSEQRVFLKDYLLTEMEKSGLKLGVHVMDDNSPNLQTEWAQQVLQGVDLEGGDYTVAIHWYEDKVGVYFKGYYLDKTYSDLDGKVKMMVTEASSDRKSSLNSHLSSHSFSNNVDTNWQNAELYSIDIIESFNHYVSGFIDFNLILDQNGGPSHSGSQKESLVTIDTVNDVYYKTPAYYHIGHFSKFLDNTFRVVKIIQNFGTISSSDVHCLAAVNFENLVIVCLNIANEGINVWFKVDEAYVNTFLTGSSIRTIVVPLGSVDF